MTHCSFVVVYDRQGCLLLRKKVLIRKTSYSDKMNNFSQNFQCYGEKLHPVMFILLLLLSFSSKSVHLFQVYFQMNAFALGSELGSDFFPLGLSFNRDAIGSGGTWFKSQGFGAVKFRIIFVRQLPV